MYKVLVYIQISANYMFRPLLVRPSSGWIPSPRKYTIVLYNHWSQEGGDLFYKNGACVQAIVINICIVYISLSIIGRLVGVLGGSGFLHCLVGWLGVTAVRCYGLCVLFKNTLYITLIVVFLTAFLHVSVYLVLRYTTGMTLLQMLKACLRKRCVC